MSIKIKPEEATADAFSKWYQPGFSHDIKKLRKLYFNAGSTTTWNKFKYAVRAYEHALAEGLPEHDALIEAKKRYPGIVLKKLRSWKPTKNLTSSRTGKHARDMQNKRGRKKKASAGTYVGLANAIEFHPHQTDS